MGILRRRPRGVGRQIVLNRGWGIEGVLVCVWKVVELEGQEKSGCMVVEERGW